MTPLTRKITYAISFETFGIILSTAYLLLLSDASPKNSVILSVAGATIALAWNFVFNLAFEAWEARQPIKGRPLALRTAHAMLFEVGLTALMVPLMAWWLDVSLLTALTLEIGLILLFVTYTYAFTWAFDRLFGLPQSAR
jgi:uncharacterized membrane protein